MDISFPKRHMNLEIFLTVSLPQQASREQ